MNAVVGGRVFEAPNGYTLVRVFRHGYVEFLTDEDDETKQMIMEMSALAMEMVKKPADAFLAMGWKEAPPPRRSE